VNTLGCAAPVSDGPTTEIRKANLGPLENSKRSQGREVSHRRALQVELRVSQAQESGCRSWTSLAQSRAFQAESGP
jgi:hypothetical protein